MNKTREIRLIYVILLLSVSLLLTAIISTFRIFNDTRHNFNQVENSNAVIRRASAFESYLSRTEAKIWLAVITNNPEDLTFEGYSAEGAKRLEQIKASTTDAQDIEKIDSLRVLLDEKFAIWERIQQALRDPGSGENLVIGLSAHGAKVSDHAEAIAERLRSNEKMILNDSIAKTRHGIAVISIVLTASTIFSLVFILFAFGRLHGEVKKKIGIQVKLQNKIEELDRSNAHLERFAYTASHDLQEPLRKLHAFSEKLVLLEKNNLSLEGKEIIDRMQKFVSRMQQLIDDLLLFSRIISDKLVKEPVDLNRVLSEVKQNMSENIVTSGTTISASRLPQIAGYESQLQQLFQNLISNSIRYAKRTVPPRISIKASVVTGNIITGVKAGDEAKKFNLLMFSDNGIGFDNKYAEKIFEIFQRLHGKSEYEGTGIGLAICKLVVENHEGYIRASGKEGEGATVMVYFPLIQNA